MIADCSPFGLFEYSVSTVCKCVWFFTARRGRDVLRCRIDVTFYLVVETDITRFLSVKWNLGKDVSCCPVHKKYHTM